MGTKAKTMHNGQSRDVRLRVYSIFLVLGTGKDGTVWRRQGVMIAETAVSDNDIGCDCGLRMGAAGCSFCSFLDPCFPRDDTSATLIEREKFRVLYVFGFVCESAERDEG